jgi:zinc protease
MRSLIKARSSIISIIIGSIFVGTASFAQQSEGWRRQAPPARPARAFDLPTAREVKLENGLTLVMIEDHRTPLVTINAGLSQSTQGGVASNLMSKVALAEATGELLTEGAGTRASEQLAREVETLGGQISSSASSDYAIVSAAVISENAEAMIGVLADVLARPAFHSSEVALYKNNRIENLTVDRQNPSFLVREHFNRVIYGSHPYGIVAPTPEVVRLITREKIARFYESSYSPAASVVVIVGDFDSIKIEANAARTLGKWKRPLARATKHIASATPQPPARHVYLIDRPGSEQADFRVGNLAVARSDADYFPLLVANAVLGGERTGSRLFMNLREQKGYTYDVYSAVSAQKRGGTFFGGSATRTEVAIPAINEMLAEFDRLRNEEVPAQELQNAKNYLTGSFSISLSTQGGIADEILQTRLLGLSADYLKNYRARIEAVTAKDVQRAARKYILTDRPVIVVVGDAAKLRKELSRLGPVDVFDIKSRPRK